MSIRTTHVPRCFVCHLICIVHKYNYRNYIVIILIAELRSLAQVRVCVVYIICLITEAQTMVYSYTETSVHSLTPMRLFLKTIQTLGNTYTSYNVVLKRITCHTDMSLVSFRQIRRLIGYVFVIITYRLP